MILYLPSKPHDAFFKALLKDPENLQLFLKNFLPQRLLKSLNLNNLQILSEEKIPVVEVPFLDRTSHIYLLIEHKSTPDIRTFLQIGFQHPLSS